ncbi:putative quinol monooxygenase [Halobacillus sp. KGW1]|uniref:putative quinol monooxygenase n=1 Tax=Halobacillus sp. KGW1 TaxID=1793726 RepID=UPI0007833032|nr:putative quinol monooxygenase [Halobacillus sp. KGW1]
MYIIHATLEVDPQKKPEFLEATRALMEGSREEEGNVFYNLMKDTEKENVYQMIEIWKDAAAMEEHNKSSHLQNFVKKAKELLTAPMDLNIYEGNKVEK